jgi:hypothetical protein
MLSDNIPRADNNQGLYAFDFKVKLTPELLDKYLGKVEPSNPLCDRSVGIVELRGHIIVHADGIIRAQWAKPIIIWVFAEAGKDWMTRLYQAYHCPIIATDDFVASLDNWTKGDGTALIEQNEYKSACFGESAKDRYGMPQISKESYHPIVQNDEPLIPKAVSKEPTEPISISTDHKTSTHWLRNIFPTHKKNTEQTEVKK